MSKIYFQSKHVIKTKRKQMWEGHGLQVQKVGMVGQTKGVLQIVWNGFV